MRTITIIEREDILESIDKGHIDEIDLVECIRQYITNYPEDTHSSYIDALVEELNKMLYNEWSSTYGPLKYLYQIAPVEEGPLLQSNE